MIRRLIMLVACCVGFVSGSAFALNIETTNGIEVLFVNGKPAPESGVVHFSDNQLQLVVRYEGRLKKNGGKLEFLSTSPYIISLQSESKTDSETIHLKLVSHKYGVVDDNNRDKKPIYQVVSSFPVQVTQQVLPAKSKVLPYMNLAPLIKDFNQQHKTVFADKPLGSTKKRSATTVEQLKFWFEKASAQERREFLQWAEKQ